MIAASYVLGMIPMEFYAIVALLVLAVIGLAGWSAERDKCNRILTATKELERIYQLSAEALQEHSKAKLTIVNGLIETWDQTYGEEIGEPIAKLQWAPAS